MHSRRALCSPNISIRVVRPPQVPSTVLKCPRTGRLERFSPPKHFRIDARYALKDRASLSFQRCWRHNLNVGKSPPRCSLRSESQNATSESAESLSDGAGAPMASARPAEPLLASALIDDEALCALLESELLGQPVLTKNEGVLITGSKSVDDALGGGMERGRMVGVWSEAGAGGMEVCMSLMADSLLQNPHNVAGVVDTTGHFDVLRLYAFLYARVQDDTELLKRFADEDDGKGKGPEEITAKMLDRVKIMRAFDLVGVMEAVSEVSDELEGRKPVSREDIPENKDERGEEAEALEDSQEKHQQATKEETTKEQKVSNRTFVADSDDEDELLFDDEPAELASAPVAPTETVPAEKEDELLFVDGADDRIAVSSPPWNSPPRSGSQTPIDVQTGPHSLQKRTAFLLIDDLAHVVSPLLKQDYVQAQALISSFLLTLSRLTHTHSLHTLISNSSIPPRPPAAKENPDSERRQQPVPPPSIFLSNKHVPALLGLSLPYLDMSLLVERMPRGKNDARAVFNDGEMVQRVRPGVKMVSVVEIMSDRWGIRGGGWGTFTFDGSRLEDV